MPAMRSYLGSAVAPAIATGLTGLDQTAAAFSWGAWVWNRTSSTTTLSSLWSHTDNAAAVRNGISISLLSRGRVDCTIADAATQGLTSPDGFCMGGWMHLGIRYDGARMQMFRNGTLVTEGAVTKAPAVSGTRQTAVGQSAGGVLTFLPDIWDVRVFPAVTLTRGEMKALADPRSKLIGCKQRLFWQRNWRAAGGGAVTVFDESGNSNNLTTDATTLNCATAAEPPWHRILYGAPAPLYVSTPATVVALKASLLIAG